jgi:hypothetical protein
MADVVLSGFKSFFERIYLGGSIYIEPTMSENATSASKLDQF